MTLRQHGKLSTTYDPPSTIVWWTFKLGGENFRSTERQLVYIIGKYNGDKHKHL